MFRPDKAYLGDSVYVDRDDTTGDLVLTSEKEDGHPDPQISIVLNRTVYAALDAYIRTRKRTRVLQGY